MRNIAATIGCVVAFAAAAPASLAAPADAPTLTDFNDAAVTNWIGRNIRKDGYLHGATVPEFAELLFLPDSVETTPTGVRAVVRGELFKAEKLSGVRTRSFRDVWEFDCAGKRIRVLESVAYPQSNLQGPPLTPDIASQTDWGDPYPESEPEHELILQACGIATIAKADRARALPTGDMDYVGPRTRDWMARNIALGGYEPVYSRNGIEVSYLPKELRRSEADLPVFSIRAEMVMAAPTQLAAWRSLRSDTEVDCETLRVRDLKLELYPGSNLLGAPVKDPEPPRWREARAGTVDASWLTPLCARLGKTFPGSASRAAPSPAPEPGGEPAWIEANLNTNGYVAKTVSEAVVLYGSSDLELLDNGHMRASMRVERYKPFVAADKSVMSTLERVEIDCEKGREQGISFLGYSARNLEGEEISDAPFAWRKIDAKTLRGEILAEVCMHRPLLAEAGDLSHALPTPLPRVTEEGVGAWIVNNVDLGDYTFSSYGDEAAAFYSLKEVERTQQDFVRVWVRFERFQPALAEEGLVRSFRVLTEFDCAEGRHRFLSEEDHIGANLTGPARQVKSPAEWEFARPQTMLSETLSNVCEMKDAADEQADDPANALPTRLDRQTL